MNVKIFVVFIVLYLTDLPKICAIEARKHLIAPKGFLVYRSNTITQRPCSCPIPSQCSCCENVIIIYQIGRKRLCVNLTYLNTGLNANVTLNSNAIRSVTVTNYKPFKVCARVPGSFFSTLCMNIIELNQFPRSLTACLRLDITSKKESWQISYTCVSISTELPGVNVTISTVSPMPPGMSSVMPPAMTSAMPPAMTSAKPPAMPSAMPPAMPSANSSTMPPAGMPAMTSAPLIEPY